MASIDPKTHQSMVELRGLAKAWQRQKADDLFRLIVSGSNHETLTLLSHDLREVLSTFEKKRKRSLTELLESALAGRRVQSPVFVRQEQAVTGAELSEKYASRLNELRDKHIFQWATFYRDNVAYICKDAVGSLPSVGDGADVEEIVQALFAEHSTAIFQHGYNHVRGRGLAEEIAVAKSLRGLQQFIYLIMALMIEQRDAFSAKQDAGYAWDIASAMITGILLGYSHVAMENNNGVSLLNQNMPAWLPALGFCRGRHVIQLAEGSNPVIQKTESAICSLLLGIDRWATQANPSLTLPRLSRVNLGANRLDITYSTGLTGVNRDLAVCAFFNGGVSSTRDLEDAIALQVDVIVADLSDNCREWVESNDFDRIIDSSDAKGSISQFQNLAETIAATLGRQSRPAGEDLVLGRITRNYAKEFPLDDPEFRRLFEVERHSVKQIVQDLQRGTGAYVWCSVRRSGKTTAASALTDSDSQTLVVFQSMDHRPNALEINLLSSKVRSALDDGRAIAENFFQAIVDDCVAATVSSSAKPRKLVFIVDEYESLFGLVDAYASRDPGIRHTVAQPLLSQMLAFSMKNILLFIGQRPDAHLILLSQNQLSPNVRQHEFPLFSHTPGTASEFTQLVRRVLSEKLPFSDAFANAVYEETRGHPYLTVNLLVDMCDWLIRTDNFNLGDELDARHFTQFSGEHLVPAQLKRSPYYTLFHSMLAEFTSERSRQQEPWLYAVTSVLREIALKHPKRLSCSLPTYEKFAKPLESLVHLPPPRLLLSAVKANFLKDHDGMVKPAIPLMARLAASAEARTS